MPRTSSVALPLPLDRAGSRLPRQSSRVGPAFWRCFSAGPSCQLPHMALRARCEFQFPTRHPCPVQRLICRCLLQMPPAEGPAQRRSPSPEPLWRPTSRVLPSFDSMLARADSVQSPLQRQQTASSGLLSQASSAAGLARPRSNAASAQSTLQRQQTSSASSLFSQSSLAAGLARTRSSAASAQSPLRRQGTSGPSLLSQSSSAAGLVRGRSKAAGMLRTASTAASLPRTQSGAAAQRSRLHRTSSLHPVAEEQQVEQPQQQAEPEAAAAAAHSELAQAAAAAAARYVARHQPGEAQQDELAAPEAAAAADDEGYSSDEFESYEPAAGQRSRRRAEQPYRPRAPELELESRRAARSELLQQSLWHDLPTGPEHTPPTPLHGSSPSPSQRASLIRQGVPLVQPALLMFDAVCIGMLRRACPTAMQDAGRDRSHVIAHRCNRTSSTTYVSGPACSGWRCSYKAASQAPSSRCCTARKAACCL